jgi:hypothetical protein
MKIEKMTLKEAGCSCNFCKRGVLDEGVAFLKYPYQYVYLFQRDSGSGMTAFICENCLSQFKPILFPQPLTTPDEQALEKEAEALYPHKVNESRDVGIAMEVSSKNLLSYKQRSAYLEAARKYISRVKELEEKLKQTEEIARIAKEDRDDWKRISKHAGNRR